MKVREVTIKFRIGDDVDETDKSFGVMVKNEMMAAGYGIGDPVEVMDKDEDVPGGRFFFTEPEITVQDVKI